MEDIQTINQTESTELEADLKRPARSISRWLPSLNAKTLNIFIFSAFIFLISSYLVLSNHLISRGFALNQTKQQFDNLQKENRALELAAMKLESSNNIKERIATLEMVKVSDLEYIEIKNSDVAMR